MLDVLGVAGGLVGVEELVAGQDERHDCVGEVVLEHGVVAFGVEGEQAQGLEHQAE